jgi:hypothetical protein
MNIIRVFPRRTNATPDDDLAIVGRTPGFFDEADEVHISVTWTYDLPVAERLAKQWAHVAPVKIGGPATGEKSGEFVPGMYVKRGYVITSRGCPNRCWFCSVWKREGNIRELPITDGWNVLDDNLLACSDEHIKKVFEMLKRQKTKAQFTGGLEAARLTDWHIDLLADLKPARIFFAYDTPDDYEPLLIAARKIFNAGILSPASNNVRAYVLVGYKGDTISAAEKRLMDVLKTGMFPMAMVFRDYTGYRDPLWVKFAWPWSRPACISSFKKACHCGADMSVSVC